MTNLPSSEMPAIFRPLDPWLSRILPYKFASKHQAVPLAITDERLTVGVAGPITPELEAELVRQTRRVIVPVPIGRDELTLLGSRLYGSEAFGFSGDFSDSGFFDPTELGLAFRLPRIRLAGRALTLALAWILPFEVAQRLRLAVVEIVGNVLVLATDRLPSADGLEEVAALTGYVPRVGLAETSEIDAYLIQSYSDLPSPVTVDWLTTALQHGMITPEDVTRVRTIALERDERLEATVERMQVLDDKARLRAVAQARGVATCRPVDEVRPKQAARILPPALARRLGIVVLDKKKDRVELAVGNWTDQAGPMFLSALLDAPVAVKLALPADIQAALDLVYRAGDGPEAPTAHELASRLAYSALATGESAVAAVADRTEKKTGQTLGLVERLMNEGYEPMAAVESVAIALSLPWLDVFQSASDANALALAPERIARAHGVLPLRLDGGLAVCAVRDAEDPETRAAIRRETGLVLAPVIVDPTKIDRLITMRYATPRSGLTPALMQVIETLTAENVLSLGSAAMVQNHITVDHVAFDIALDQAAVPDIVDVLSRFSGRPKVDLAYIEKDEVIVDALGRSESRRRYIDPVDRDIARLIDADTAMRLGALPFAIWGRSYAVALADPLDERVVSELTEILEHPVEVWVAKREDLEAAIRRHLVQRTLGDYLLESGIIDRIQLSRALDLQRRAGIRIGKALISLGYVTEATVATYLAEQHRLPFYELGDTPVDPEIVRLIPADLARERGLLPLAVTDGVMTLAMADPLDGHAIEQVAHLTGLQIRPVLVVDKDIDQGLESVYRLEYLERSARDLLFRYPEESAARVLSNGQKVFFITLLLVCAVAIVIAPIAFMTFFVSIATLFYITFSVYKFYLVFRSMANGKAEIGVTREEALALDERDLPIYTILVPMYKEPEVLSILVAACDRLEYPKAKLDVKLLLEEDDVETIDIARRANLPPHFDIVVVPDGKPKGKPKACNYGLIKARGEFVVIYDAEDIPEPDQLRKAIVAFQKAGDAVACIQARLNYFNRDQNILTRWFTTEYSMWFDLFLPGLDATNAPIPLGGTSNHFRADRLRDLGGWDPFNVTEDADLGMRLFKMGWKTAVLESTTYEEANSHFGNWIRQRSRWVKGYIQTYLVQMRHPIKLWQQIGPYPFFSFQMVIGGTFLGFLLNPIFWTLTALWFLTKWSIIQEIFPPPIFYLGAFGLYIGNFAFLYINVAGCIKREYYGLVKYALLSPLYWAMMSIAAWKALYQLFTKPFYWEKTRHGLYKGNISIDQIGAPPS